ncbi:GMC family oxidoreductase [Peterkaempfera sp. SMS 1(5)a]|uniref:GMC family oxidoreductase n=1 Tax=Peterkaempfera podocarpi TaxID=3232308 RepID=UPI00366AD991
MEQFDYVVVGAGSAGCVIAARLSEDPHRQVLLLEAGAADGPEAMAVPSAWPTLIGSEVDWGYSTVPQSAAGGIPRRYPRGKVLGGSSSINGMSFIRGHRSDYDAWAATAPGWGYEDLLPYFKRSETTQGRDPAYRGIDGPVRVGPASDVHPLSRAFLDAAQAVGFPRTDDLNGSDQEGVCWSDLNIVDGARQSAADAYLRPVLDRANLTVLTDALVHRLIVTDGRCTRVEYSVGTDIRRAYAHSETILSAGSIGSAHLLLLSGIGPADQLRDLGVDVVADLPGVGANLQDHPLAGIVYTAAQPVPPGRNNHGEIVAAVRTAPNLAAPDVHVFLVDIPYHPPWIQGPATGYTIVFSALHPYSRGSVRLAGADPATAPLIDPNFFGDDRDMVTMLTALDLAREIGRSPAFDDWRDQEAFPGPDAQDESELRDCLGRDADPYQHAVGTCRIGTDPAAVVDPRLRVYGIEGLRVADASVMPIIPGANPHATVLAVAERAAALVGG